MIETFWILAGGVILIVIGAPFVSFDWFHDSHVEERIEAIVARRDLESLEERGFISVTVDRRRVRATLAHPLYGDVVRSSIPDLRRHRLTRSLADTLEHQGVTGRDDSMRLALWRLDGVDHAGAVLNRKAAADATKFVKARLR